MNRSVKIAIAQVLCWVPQCSDTIAKIAPLTAMSTQGDDEQEINVDVDSDSRMSCGGSASDIDCDGGGSCYDDSETAIR